MSTVGPMCDHTYANVDSIQLPRALELAKCSSLYLADDPCPWVNVFEH